MINFLSHMKTFHASARQIRHYVQLTDASRLVEYDYGTKRENYLHYGQPSPPDYELENISAEMIIWHAMNDTFTDLSVSLSSKQKSIFKNNFFAAHLASCCALTQLKSIRCAKIYTRRFSLRLRCASKSLQVDSTDVE